MTKNEYLNLKINDIIVCIDNKYIEYNISLNKYYTVVSKDKYFSSCCIIDDNNRKCQFNYIRFEQLSKIRIDKLNNIFK